MNSDIKKGGLLMYPKYSTCCDCEQCRHDKENGLYFCRRTGLETTLDHEACKRMFENMPEDAVMIMHAVRVCGPE